MTTIAAKRIEALGTYVDVAVGAPAFPSPLIADLEREIRLLDGIASCFRPDSEVRMLHRRGLVVSPGRRWYQVSPELYEMLSFALWAAEVTDGLVDPTVGGELLRWRAYGPGEDSNAIGGPLSLLERRRDTSYRSVLLDQEHQAVAFRRGTLFDLHSISKGLWADRIASVLSSSYGIDVLVGLGGDIAIVSPGGTRFSIAVPLNGGSTWSPSDSVFAVELSGGGVATSSVRWRAIERLGRRGTKEIREHIVDPRTRHNSTGKFATVSVVAPSAALANVYSLAGIVDDVRGRTLLSEVGYPARFVAREGHVEFVNGWPRPEVGGSERWQQR